jgi:hypothetical protein
MPDKQKIIKSIQDIAKKLGRAPSRAEFALRSKISSHFVLKFFSSWTEAVRAAGLQPAAQSGKIPDRALLEDWGRVVRKNRGLLPRHMFRRLARYSPAVLARRCGGWARVPQMFRKFARRKQKWADVVSLLPAPGAEDSLDSLDARLAAESTRELRKKDRARADRGQASGTAFHTELKDRPVCGGPMPFRSLRYEPVNEQGVVLLFGMLAEGLGYTVEHVQQGFPDCEARRQVGPERWQRVRIEFEYESRNFMQHGHPHRGCDVIVCWRHNWPEHPERLEVLELSRVMRGMSSPEMRKL